MKTKLKFGQVRTADGKSEDIQGNCCICDKFTNVQNNGALAGLSKPYCEKHYPDNFLCSGVNNK